MFEESTSYTAQRSASVLCSDAVGMKVRVPVTAMSWRVSSQISPAFMHKQEKGVDISQHVKECFLRALCLF